MFKPDKSDTEDQRCDICLHYSSWNSSDYQSESDVEQIRINFYTDQNFGIAFPLSYQKSLDPSLILEGLSKIRHK